MLHDDRSGPSIGPPGRPLTIHEFADPCQSHLGTILSSNKGASIHASCELLDAVPRATSYVTELALVNALKQILKAYAWLPGPHGSQHLVGDCDLDDRVVNHSGAAKAT